MRPLSTYNPLNVMGQGYAPLAMLSGQKLKNTLDVLDSYEEKQNSAQDTVSISEQAKELQKNISSSPGSDQSLLNEEEIKEAESIQRVIEFGVQASKDIHNASDEERLRDLEERDRKVRQRVKAQQRAAGNLAGGPPNYSYEIGPDGKQYAVEGHTNIKVRSGFSAEERLKNAKRAERAAQAGDGSSTPQSSRLAAEARQEADKAQREIVKESEENSNDSPLKKSGKREKNNSSNWYLKSANEGYKESLNSTHQRLD